MRGLFDSGQRISIAVCTPWPMKTLPDGRRVHEPMSPLWFRSRMGLSMPTNFNMIELFADGMEVDEARNQTARACLNHSPRPEFIFFIDYDVLLPPDALTKLFFRAKTNPDIDIFCGVYCCKWQNPPDPLIYTENGAGAFWDWAVGDLLTTKEHGINAVHSGLTLIRTSLYQKMLDEGVVHGDGTNLDDEPFYKTVYETEQIGDTKLLKMGTEDIYFHHKARQVGAQIMVDTSVLAGHHDKNTGITYGLPWGHGPTKKAKWMKGSGKTVSQDQEEAQKAGLKIALDIGAGGTRREWPGYVTYTTDLRKDTNPDYVMDSRLLNLPDNHFDLVSSSHHLEHLPRYEQERVWSEIFRITKPGGVTEHCVPDIGWAAAHIRDGAVSQEVYDVLYGAQERLGFARDMNTHFFGYTREVGKALAEQAGFVEVEVRNWLDDETLGYNLIIRGKKPGGETPEPSTNGYHEEEEAKELVTVGAADFLDLSAGGDIG